MSFTNEHFYFVTGRLAEQAVRTTVARVAEELKFQYTIGVLPITVAALMTPKWILRHLVVPPHATQVMLPGCLSHNLEDIAHSIETPVVCGPRDIRDLPLFFGNKRPIATDYGKYSIEIIAEINHAPKLSSQALLEQALFLKQQGADVIDVGCTPGHRWTKVSDAIKQLRDLDIRVSIDSFDSWEVAQACAAGAQLVLSVNSSNRAQAVDWGAEVVVIPDTPDDKKSFEETIFFLTERDISVRLDPILEPLGCGFASSLERYTACRRSYPQLPMMMGIGNVTELTDADSAPINVLLLGICQELNIQSVLTTQVINWARSSVRECDLARRMMHYAVEHRIPPKHLEPQLVTLRDTRVTEFDNEILDSLARTIRDRNIRIFTRQSEIHAVSAGVHVHATDPFEVAQQLLDSAVGATIDPAHAFYLGFEMAKALTANTLSKQYEQDVALDWGFLTRAEQPHRLSRKPRSS
ncbi:DUF6513 domain-containing protein [Aureliella helgolandensis]|uniref:Pterin binding enzyme n=1 Tax=Aureliella helgolandensis TaxID=2527968 RepID=A0A518G2L4_9BACT|nr:DUF6513 domain-containing protein [Aureliella helgolandensis]QDV22828.1 Pterin binding enzyme [Aureliella helgolandensis]